MTDNEMQQILVEEASAEQRLSRQIVSFEQVSGMTAEELDVLGTAHDLEILQLQGRIDAAPQTRWAVRARQALRVLHLHKNWITRELRSRRFAEKAAAQKQEMKSAREARKKAQEEHARQQQEAHAAKVARIKAANDETRQQIEVFKEVAREVLGAEMYAYLWELTRSRLDTQKEVA